MFPYAKKIQHSSLEKFESVFLSGPDRLQPTVMFFIKTIFTLYEIL